MLKEIVDKSSTEGLLAAAAAGGCSDGKDELCKPSESSFCWQNVSVWKREKETRGLWRKTKYKDVQVVKNASGFVPQASLLAIMGPSGSGKTTLLTAISRRLKDGVLGNVCVNGQVVNADQMLAVSSFVSQDDLTMEGMTVYEHFKIMAALKMDRNTSSSIRTEKMSELMQEIGIKKLSSSYLCDLSGGERRRLSIAVQLLNDPLILFCDEPTTGLDSTIAAMVIKLLKKFSARGKIVICSIHQPSALVYELFDRVLLLASGGRTAYFGPVLQSSNYFHNLGISCPSGYNIAEFLINNVSPRKFDADEQRIGALCEHYSTSSIQHVLQERINNVSKIPRRKEGRKIVLQEQMDQFSDNFIIRKPTLMTQTSVLIQRSCYNLKRDYTKIVVLLATQMFVTAFLTLAFGSVTLCSENSFQNIRGALCCLALNIFHEFAYHQHNVLESEKFFVLREVNNGLYRIEAYCVAKFFGKLVVSVLVSVILVVIFVSVSQAFSHIPFLNLVLICSMITISGTAYGCMLSSAFDDFNILFLFSITYENLAYLFCGIAININSLPLILGYLRYLSLIYYFIEYFLVLEWKVAASSDIQCTSEDGTYHNGTNTNAPMVALQLLAENGYDVQYYQKDVWILVFFSLILFIISYIFLRKKSREWAAY